MDCLILESAFLKANGVFPCHDDAGDMIPLGHLTDDFSWRGLLDDGYAHVRRELEAGRAPWPGTCERCGFFRPHRPYRARPAHRLTTFQVEPTLACGLVCPGCTRKEKLITRSGPSTLTLDRFAQLLKTAAAEQVEIEWIEYCGHGEPLAHREFHRFVATARQIMPRTRQRLITNANYDYGAVMQGQYVDELIVSCDGATAETYPVYRQKGNFARVQSFLAEATRATPRPFVVWKYILFDFNDSTPELQLAQRLAIEYGVDALLFVVTHSVSHSERYMAGNMEQVLKVTPFATVSTTPVLEPPDASRPSLRIRSEVRRTRVERLMDAARLRIRKRAPALESLAPERRGALDMDYALAIDSGTLHVRGWAHDGLAPFEHLTASCNGREVGSAVVGIRRPDVLPFFPRLGSDRVGFVATLDLPVMSASGVDLELRGTPRDSTRSTVFSLQIRG